MLNFDWLLLEAPFCYCTFIPSRLNTVYSQYVVHKTTQTHLSLNQDQRRIKPITNRNVDLLDKTADNNTTNREFLKGKTHRSTCYREKAAGNSTLCDFTRFCCHTVLAGNKRHWHRKWDNDTFSTATVRHRLSFEMNSTMSLQAVLPAVKKKMVIRQNQSLLFYFAGGRISYKRLNFKFIF